MSTTNPDTEANPDEEWALQGDQLAFMQKHHAIIEAAYASGDLGPLDALADSDEYRALFGEMSWDEAYDRYEETWWQDDDGPDSPPEEH